METYQSLRTFADSYGLAAMVAVFVFVVAFVYLRPGAKRDADEAANIPFRDSEER